MKLSDASVEMTISGLEGRGSGKGGNKDNRRSPSGMTTRNATAKANAGLSTAHQKMRLSDASVEMTTRFGY
jgi:hypothetical protein